METIRKGHIIKEGAGILLKSEKGMAMPLAICLSAIAMLLCTVIITYAVSAVTSAAKQEDAAKAEYIARSGLEAVIKAWKDADGINEKPGGTVDRIYLMKDGTYKNENSLSQHQIDTQTEAYIDVTVTKKDDGTTEFVAIGNKNGVKRKIVVNSSSYVSGHDAGWYNYQTGIINTSKNNSNTGTVMVNGREYKYSYHDPQGIVDCYTDKNISLKLQSDNTKNKIAYLAQMVRFNCPVDLSLTGDIGPEGALVVSAQCIVFKENVYLRDGAYTYGTLGLDVPDDMGIKLVNKAGVYGRVYFEKDVILHYKLLFGWYKKTLINGPAAYYFRKRVDSKNEPEGFDLIQWGNGEYDDDDFIPIPDTDSNASTPIPENFIKFTWN